MFLNRRFGVAQVSNLLYRRLRACLSFALITTLFSAAGADDKPVSYYKELIPIFKRSCTGCHHPGKLKGQLDLTTYQTLMKGGKHGSPVTAGDPKKSALVDEISGDEPNMPEEGDPLSKAEVALIERWIAEGAKDDTPTNANSFRLAAAPIYTTPPVISALAYSPDGKLLAISGYHEVLLHASGESNLIGRLVGESPRIESIAFSPDGKYLVVAGSAPARFGEIQVWDVSSNALAQVTNLAPAKAWKVSIDSVYGASWSPQSDRVAFGCADKSVRIISISDGKELLKFDNHSDWVFGTLWTTDGKRVLTGSRDRAMKMIDAKSGQFIDDINKLIEPVLCIARHPKDDVVVYGGELGIARSYKISDNQGRTAANNDVNLRKEFERLPGPVHAVAYSADGSLIAIGGAGPEVRLHDAKDAKRKATLKGHDGAVFALAFHPQAKEIVVGGFDGSLRLYDTEKGDLLRAFIPVPLSSGPLQRASK
jgi:WD40 repeat protein